jgi:hypothetical protein
MYCNLSLLALEDQRDAKLHSEQVHGLVSIGKRKKIFHIAPRLSSPYSLVYSIFPYLGESNLSMQTFTLHERV